MTLTSHALDRAADRLTEVGIDPRVVLNRANRIAAKVDGDVAVRLLTLPARVSTHDGSNGDGVWAIIRGHRVTTLMLRRDTQPRTPAAFGVTKVLRVVEKAA